ncbi:hypothetical protein D9M72_536550 [compost metagenome]
MPYLAALCFAVLVAAAIRPWFDHEAVPTPPGFAQLLAHGLLLQDLLGYEALSTGVWYVAIDFQLFVLALFNLKAELDSTAIYFFGAYGLGMLAFWIGPRAR